MKRKSGTGRHTTILANMYSLPEGGWLVDTPGIRELMPYGMEPRELGIISWNLPNLPNPAVSKAAVISKNRIVG